MATKPLLVEPVSSVSAEIAICDRVGRIFAERIAVVLRDVDPLREPLAGRTVGRPQHAHGAGGAQMRTFHHFAAPLLAAEHVGEYPTRRVRARERLDQRTLQALGERRALGIPGKTDIDRDGGVVLALLRQVGGGTPWSTRQRQVRTGVAFRSASTGRYRRDTLDEDMTSIEPSGCPANRLGGLPFTSSSRHPAAARSGPIGMSAAGAGGAKVRSGRAMARNQALPLHVPRAVAGDGMAAPSFW